MSNKTLILAIAVVVICVLAACTIVLSVHPAPQPLTATGELDFTVNGKSDCLRFLNNSVPVVYVPFTINANQNWQLTINCTQMPGGANGWTDVYLYNDYWDQGNNNICKSGDLYPILTDIQSTDFAIHANTPYTQTFGESTQQSYTLFFVLPPGGPSTFYITLKPT
jgi:hypothetical protein